MEQSEFDFSGNAVKGFAVWRKVCEERLTDLRLKAGLPLNRRVRLKLRDFDRPFEGWLMVSTLPSNGEASRYQLANLAFDFGTDEIEWCLAAESEQGSP